MALRTNAQLSFDGYEIGDDGVALRFLCADPGPAEESYWLVRVTFNEITAGTLQDFRDLVLARLRQRFRAAGLTTRLDALIGTTVTI